MGRVLGLNCEGKEEEVMSKLMEFESMDMDKVHQKGRIGKCRKIKQVLKERKIDIALLQETKKEVVNSELVQTIWAGEKMEFMSVDSVGSAGGLLCIWNPVVFQLKNYCCNRNFILLAGSIFSSFNCVIVNVYGPNDPVGRKRVWDILMNLKSHFLEPWCLGGDFNVIKSISERKGCSRRDKGMREFNELIEQLEVFDLPMCGRKFTWCHSQEGDRWSRLDRFLLNPEWLQTFNFKLWGLPRLVSDHCPIILMEDERDWGPRPFRFINAWSLHPNFLPFVEQTWAALNVLGWAGFRCLVKFKGLKSALKGWNKEVFGNVESKLKATEEEVHALDLVAEARVLSADEVARKRELKGDAWQLSKMLERMWFQKSRLKWALLGDRNTLFFHAMARCRSNRNAYAPFWLVELL
ncbi:uncharacterized protein LOC114258112 [Camellia sinensis]|uniref:uncharacterized protein LOC114258112 n=1 Tax=Camellia sinensis TaxID=4442 RepID=UPI0010367618|nr:uncharacterized protein LOC114258112 [Camellia sinensis]